MVTPSGTTIPSVSEIRSGSTEFCSGTSLQNDVTNSMQIDCNLIGGLKYDFWVVVDGDASATFETAYLIEFYGKLKKCFIMPGSF